MPDNKKQPVIDNNVRAAWNDYVGWLRQKGIAGHPELDKNGLGHSMLDQYLRENQGSYLSKDMIPAIQSDFQNLKAYSLDQVKKGKASFAEGVNEQNFMQNLSDADGYPGQFTTSHIYPREYMNYLDEQNKPIKTEDKDFVQGYANQK